MTLYFLEWDNGLSYDDNEVYLMGVYTSAENRANGKSRLDGRKCYPFNEEGEWVESEAEADTEYYGLGEKA